MSHIIGIASFLLTSAFSISSVDFGRNIGFNTPKTTSEVTHPGITGSILPFKSTDSEIEELFIEFNLPFLNNVNSRNSFIKGNFRSDLVSKSEFDGLKQNRNAVSSQLKFKTVLEARINGATWVSKSTGLTDLTLVAS